MFFSRKKHTPSNSAPADGLASQSQARQLLQFPTKSQLQSRSQSPQQTQQLQPLRLYPWSVHTPPSGQWPSPFPRRLHALSTTVTAAGELFLFGGRTHDGNRNDLYVISTRDFSTTLLRTSGDVPSPRSAHRAVLTSTALLIWGGRTGLSTQNVQNAQKQSNDDSFYLLSFVSGEWSRIVISGPGPGGRRHHTMTLVGSKLFVFGGKSANGCLNDIWALDLNCLQSNPFWESYEPAPGNEKPLPRAGHVSVTTGDRIIIFGGCAGPCTFNSTWSFNISTRKWTQLQCTGSIPSPRAGHAAVLIDDTMYVFGGFNGETKLDDLIALQLSTQRWIAFPDIGPRPCGRGAHAMASDGRRVFVLGGELSPGAQVDETKLIHVLDTKLLIYPKPDCNTVKHSEKTIQLAQKLLARYSIRGQPHQPSSSLLDAHAAHGASPFQKTTPGELDHPTFQQITREQNPSPTGLPPRPTGVGGRPRRVPGEDNDGEGPTEHHTKLVVPPFGKEIAWLEDGHLIERERRLSQALVAEQDRHIAQLADELALKGGLLEQAKANKKRAGLVLHELQAKLDELQLSHDHTLEQAQRALQKASCAADANEQSQREIAELHAKLEARESDLAAFRSRLADMENGSDKSKAEANIYRAPIATGLVNTDEDRVVHRLMERVQAMEAEIALLRRNEKSFERIGCRNEARVRNEE